MCYKDPPPPTQKNRETCKNLLKLLPSSSRQSPPARSPMPLGLPTLLNTFSSFPLILEEKMALILSTGVIFFPFICQDFPLSLCYSCLHTNPPTRR